MDLFKIAVVLAAVCSVAYTYAKGRDITQYSKATKRPISPYNRWRSCIEKGFHPPSRDFVPSVSVDLVPAGTLNYSRSVSCYEPGENYDVIIRSSAHIYGVLVMPLKVGLRKYRDNLVSVGTMRSSRLNRDLFMDSICSDQSVSHKSSFKSKRLTTLTIPWDAPNGTCSVEFIHHVVFSYGCWRLGRTVPYPVCNETRNETSTETMESTESTSNSGSGSGSGSGNNGPTPSASSGRTPPTKLPKTTTAANTKLATEKHTNETSQSQSLD